MYHMIFERFASVFCSKSVMHRPPLDVVVDIKSGPKMIPQTAHLFSTRRILDYSEKASGRFRPEIVSTFLAALPHVVGFSIYAQGPALVFCTALTRPQCEPPVSQGGWQSGASGTARGRCR